MRLKNSPIASIRSQNHKMQMTLRVNLNFLNLQKGIYLIP